MRILMLAAYALAASPPEAAGKVNLTCEMVNRAGDLVTLDFVLEEANGTGDYSIRQTGFHREHVPTDFTSKVVTIRASSDPSFVNTYTIDRVTLAVQQSAAKDGVELFTTRGKCELAKPKF